MSRTYSSTSEDSGLASFGALIVALFISVLFIGGLFLAAVIVDAIVIGHVWNALVIKLLPVVHLELWQAAALGLICGVLTYHNAATKLDVKDAVGSKTSDDTYKALLGMFVIRPVIIIVIASFISGNLPSSAPILIEQILR